MKPSTRMMIMGNRSGKNGNREGRDDREMYPEYGRGDHSMNSREMYGRENHDMRSETGGYGDRSRERGYRGPQRMYASGSIWADDGDDHTGQPKEVDERQAMEWAGRMKNSDGSKGPHFKPEMAEQLRSAHCPECEKWEFFVALNMMYSDYADVAKKFAADKPEFYTCMAKAFLEDKDAGKGKLSKYMEYIPKG